MATNAQLLQEAKDAKHKLVTGKLARVFMDQNGERVEFNKTNIADLDSYISQLEAAVNPSAAKSLYRKPLGFTF
jgi:hypothetical protein